MERDIIFFFVINFEKVKKVTFSLGGGGLLLTPTSIRPWRKCGSEFFCCNFFVVEKNHLILVNFWERERKNPNKKVFGSPTKLFSTILAENPNSYSYHTCISYCKIGTWNQLKRETWIRVRFKLHLKWERVCTFKADTGSMGWGGRQNMWSARGKKNESRSNILTLTCGKIREIKIPNSGLEFVCTVTAALLLWNWFLV